MYFKHWKLFDLYTLEEELFNIVLHPAWSAYPPEVKGNAEEMLIVVLFYSGDVL